jgi:hypothetical protein
MKIDGTTFGSITIDGKTYDHDVIVRLSEKVEKRKKKLSKRIYGTSHTVSEDEAKFVIEKGCKQLIFGTGHDAMASLSPEAAAFLNKRAARSSPSPHPRRSASSTSARRRRSGCFT